MSAHAAGRQGGAAADRTHGGIAAEHAARVLDLSVCVNPWGPPAAVRRAIAEADVTRYPDPECRQARRALAGALDVAEAHVVLGSGAAELIWSLVRAVLRPGEHALCWEPCFSEFAAAAAATGAELHAVRTLGTTPAAAMAAGVQALQTLRPKLCYLCAPSSPLGQWLPVAELAEVVRRFPDTTFIVDQSYLAMSQQAAELSIELPSNAVRLRSLTKELGIPGVRIGYALMSPALATALSAQRPHWCVGAAAQAAASCYGEVRTELAQQVTQLLALAQSLSHELRALQLSVHPSATHYFVFDRPAHAGLSTPEFVAQLLREHAIYVRDCTSFGLPDAVRVAAHPEQARLLRALPHATPQLGELAPRSVGRGVPA